MTLENTTFLAFVADIGIVAATATVNLILEELHSKYGLNFNTLIIKNNDAVEFKFSMDGVVWFYLAPGDFISFDHEDRLNFNTIRVTNADGATASVANKLRITVGRTGTVV